MDDVLMEGLSSKARLALGIKRPIQRYSKSFSSALIEYLGDSRLWNEKQASQ